MTGRHIYIVRHAIAEEVAADGRDESRALTPEGRKKMKKAARGLAALDVAPARLFSSPLVRARETAEILAGELGGLEVELTDTLAPGVDERALTRLVDATPVGDDVMLVGHEPDLSSMLAYWLTGSRGGFETDFKKGAVACLAIDLLPPRGKAILEWLLTAGQLGRIG